MGVAEKRILYVSGSIGMGHVTRDLAIAGQLRKQYPEVELFWLASHPATIPLKEAGEKLLPEADVYANANIHAEKAARGSKGRTANLRASLIFEASAYLPISSP